MKYTRRVMYDFGRKKPCIFFKKHMRGKTEMVDDGFIELCRFQTTANGME